MESMPRFLKRKKKRRKNNPLRWLLFIVIPIECFALLPFAVVW
jgi:hypothetical protein